ncbi:MAG TPA: DUF2752 domain-containing protein [Thermoanaerobaculia bacterium]|nr:DUF2752 domain-containing protein [Thermoanaerobaculia bacterium]
MRKGKIFDVIAAGIGSGILLLSALIAFARSRGIDLLPGRSICWSIVFFDSPCPGCGLTRSFIALAGGDWEGAAALNMLGPPLFLATVTLLLLHGWSLVRPDFHPLRVAQGVVAAAAAGLIVAHSFYFYVLR